MPLNAPQFVIELLERYTTEALALHSVPPEVLRDELQSVRERVGELIEEIERAEVHTS